MIAYMVTSINRHFAQEITIHFTEDWVKMEMGCRLACGHSAVQCRQVEVQPKPGRREGGKV